MKKPIALLRIMDPNSTVIQEVEVTEGERCNAEGIKFRITKIRKGKNFLTKKAHIKVLSENISERKNSKENSHGEKAQDPKPEPEA